MKRLQQAFRRAQLAPITPQSSTVPVPLSAEDLTKVAGGLPAVGGLGGYRGTETGLPAVGGLRGTQGSGG